MVSATRSLLCAALLLLLAISRQATGRSRHCYRGEEGPPVGASAHSPADPVSSPIGAPVNELRCQCLQTVAGIHLKNIQSLKVTPPGPHCTQTEVM